MFCSRGFLPFSGVFSKLFSSGRQIRSKHLGSYGLQDGLLELADLQRLGEDLGLEKEVGRRASGVGRS